MIHAANARTIYLPGHGHIGRWLHKLLSEACLLSLRTPRLALFETKQPATGNPKPNERKGEKRN
jgi:hypothetical protein